MLSKLVCPASTALVVLLVLAGLTSGDSSVVLAASPTAPPSGAATPPAPPARSEPEPDPTWARGAVDALMDSYDRSTGLWRGIKWWNSANALTSVIDYMSVTHDDRYRWVLANTYERARSAKDGDFTNGYLDDTGWWALAWIRAYDLTHDDRYLRTAQVDVDHMWDHHDGTCGGGVWWNGAENYKNAITNELFIKAAAELHNRIPGDSGYLRRALATWRWFEGSGMVDGQHLVDDGLDTDSCTSNRETAWTYNQGVIVGGLVDLARATGDRSYLRRADVLADASSAAASLHPGGVLTEPCEDSDCGSDAPTFKGVYVRNLGELAQATSSASYRDYLRREATGVHDRDRTSQDRYGLHWAGPAGQVTAATQQSAVDLMVAALR